MSTPVYGFLSSVANGTIYDDTPDPNATTTIENVFLFLAELFGGVGIVAATDFNGTAVAGQLSVDIGGGRAILGTAGTRKFYRTTSTTQVTGLADNRSAGAPNYVWPKEDGTFSHDTDPGNQPAGSVLVCTCETCNGQVSNVDNAPAGRKNIIDALAVRVSGDDVQAGYLSTKIAAGHGISVTADDGGDERLTIALSPSGSVTTEDIVDGAVTAAKLANEAVDLSTAKVTGALPLALGGTGASTDAGARTNLGLGSMAI